MLSLGLACHAQLLHYGFQADTLTSNLLINMYSKCGNVVYCRAVFDQMHAKSAVSWNTIISAYAVNDAGEALQLFLRMFREGSEMSEYALSSVLCGCASKVLAFECKQLHAFAIKASMELNKFVGTALVDVYAKCRFVDDAFRMFEFMPEKSDVTWSSMMAGFVQNELYEQALKLFRLERRTCEESNMFVISSVISACAATGALMQGKHVHAVVHKSGFEVNRYISSSLVDMYAKCGSIEESYIVFSDAGVKNVVVWNIIISGFSRNGRSLEAIILFEKMQQMSCCPNEITYVSLLSACAHMGLAEEGRKYFVMLKKQHGLSANAFHYACMVDVLGRTGKLEEAKDMIEEMPFEATASMWGSILGCCRVFRNVELGEMAAKKLFEIEPENGGNHVLLSNIYAACGRWDGVASVRELLKKTGAKKERGESWIEVGGEVHRFAVGDRNHDPRMDDVYARPNAMADEMEGISGFEWRMEDELHDVWDTI
ncbi:hypothetical protein M569_13297 [Genlisea aurea]|uniref:Pentatricopeptide repeat-containing protein n=1 Tax=Genlisea aurea TaxID=192259 RepID=S8C3T3_9LAMI|nr:hypothetical protein M569_13297 [Genlisea aurea]